MLWQHILDTYVDLGALHKAGPDLASELYRLRAVLDSNTTDADARMHAARGFDLVVTQIRALPPTRDLTDPAGFLARRPVAQLLPALGDGTMVIVNVSRLRCDALLLTTDGVRAVELPGLTQAEVDQRCVDYVRVLVETGAIGRFNAEMAITDTLNWLWDRIAAPVLAAIAPTADRPRAKRRRGRVGDPDRALPQVVSRAGTAMKYANRMPSARRRCCSRAAWAGTGTGG